VRWQRLDTTVPASIDDTAAGLLAQGYVAQRELATAAFLALRLQRPLFPRRRARGATAPGKNRDRQGLVGAVASGP